MISVRLDEDPRQGYLVVGFDMSAQRDIVLASLWRYLVIAGLAMVVAGLAACVMVGRVTAPVTRLRPACVCTLRPRRRGLAQQLLDDLLAGGPPAGEGALMFSCPSHAVPGHRAP
ncbi:hypothetical protein [Kocuria sp. U4B]